VVEAIKESKDHSNDLLIALVSALAGFLLGFLGTWIANRNLAKKVLIAIQAEESYIFSVYSPNLGDEIDQLWPKDPQTGTRQQNQKYFARRASSAVDWFSVFNGNTSNLGLLQEKHMRTVLETYAAMKGLIESFELNNALLEKFDPQNPDQKLLDDLLFRAKDIRESHDKYLAVHTELTSIKVGWFYW